MFNANGDQPRTAIHSIDHLIQLGLTSSASISEMVSTFEQASIKEIESPQCGLCDTDFIGIFDTKVSHINNHELAYAPKMSIASGHLEIGIDQYLFLNSDCINIANIRSYIASNSIAKTDGSNAFGQKLICSDNITIDHIEKSYKKRKTFRILSTCATFA